MLKYKQYSSDISLSGSHRSVRVHQQAGLRRFAAFLGPGYLVAVGYMDPGNWATSIAGGSKFGYTLLFVVLLSNVMAVILQSLSARLGIVTGRDLAQACRDSYPAPLVWFLWLMAQIAIIATDLAEVIGTAIGLHLLFGVPIEIGVVLTALDVFLVLLLQRLGFRWLEAVILALLLVIAGCFTVELFLARPLWPEVFRGFLPKSELLTNPDMLYLALGIIGATVMPHNLYLHSAVVQTRDFGSSTEERRSAITYANIDSFLALSFALMVNASILILAAATFHKAGQTQIAELGDAHALLAPLLGTTLAPILFAVALLCSGFNSTLTATLAGQTVMEGFIRLQLPPWIQRLLTSSLAIMPAVFVALWYGPAQTAQLLVLSQVILSAQLPFAIIPLIIFTADKRKMGDLVAPRWLIALASLSAALIIALNLKFLVGLVLG